MAITPLPSAPQITDDTATFNTKAFAWVNSIDTFTTEANALAVTVNGDATTAVNAKNDAEAAAASAIASANVTKWVSGTTYDEGDVVWSPVTFVTYRRKTTGAGTTDPSLDSTNWEQVTGTGNVTLDGSQTLTNKTIDADSNTITNVDLTTDIKGTLPVTNGGTGLASVGAAGNILTSDGSAWISQAPSARSGVFDAIAFGSLPNGIPVVLNSDGTVSAVTDQAPVGDPAAGTPAVFASAIAPSISTKYDSTNQKIVIAYRDGGNSSYATAVVGTVSGTSISFGTPVVIESASVTTGTSIAYDSANQRAIIFYGISGEGRSKVGTVSGTSISFGLRYVFNLATSEYLSSTYDSINSKVVVVYRDAGNSNLGTARVGSVSGTAISFGSAVIFAASSTRDTSATFDVANEKVVISYTDVGNLNYGTAVVGTISGTSISFGTPVIFSSSACYYTSATFDELNSKVVIAYQDNGNSNYGTAIVGTVSGTSISFGTPVVFESASSQYISSTYDSINRKIVIAYRDNGNSSYGTAIVGIVSGTSISFGTPVLFESASTSYISATYDTTNQKIVIAYTDGGNLSYGTAIVFEAVTLEPNLTSSNFVGFSENSYSDSETATIQIIGSVNSSQSGLTIGSSYYVQLDGTLSTTPDTPSVFAGTAVSSTKLIVKG